MDSIVSTLVILVASVGSAVLTFLVARLQTRVRVLEERERFHLAAITALSLPSGASTANRAIASIDTGQVRDARSAPILSPIWLTMPRQVETSGEMVPATSRESTVEPVPWQEQRAARPRSSRGGEDAGTRIARKAPLAAVNRNRIRALLEPCRSQLDRLAQGNTRFPEREDQSAV
jgi:hypothetical protein